MQKDSAQKLYFLNELQYDYDQSESIIELSLKENQNQLFYKTVNKLIDINNYDFIGMLTNYSMGYCNLDNWKKRVEFIFKLVDKQKRVLR